MHDDDDLPIDEATPWVDKDATDLEKSVPTTEELKDAAEMAVETFSMVAPGSFPLADAVLTAAAEFLIEFWDGYKIKKD